MQGVSDILPILRYIRVSQPDRNDKQLLPIPKRKAPQGFHKAQDAAGIQAAQINRLFFCPKERCVFVTDCGNAGLFGQLLRIPAGASVTCFRI